MSNTCPNCKTNNPDTLKFCGECGTQLPSIEDIEVTETIEAPKEELTRGATFAGRYEIIEELGKGGMGRVYRVDDTKLKQEVALKLIKPEIAQDKKTIERFRNELKLARNIRHKNVCGMYDLGEAKGAHFITMEYVRGEDLRSSIRRFGQLPIGKSIAIAKQICEGLAEAHKQGVVHRDLKSNNIMIDKEGNVRIMDFGIARSLEAKGITGAGVMIGTPEYMSPEQVEGKEVDQRSDIYSLGVILYEMVTGKVPFEGDTPFTVGMKHKGEMPQNPKELNSQISDELKSVILRCLEKEKESRYQSAGEVRSELGNIEKGIPTTERVIPDRKPLTSREITVQFSVKKIFVPALVILAVMIIVVFIWQLLPKKESASITPSDKPSLAVMYFENNTGDNNLDHWRKALAELLIADLSQSQHLVVLSRDRLFNILTEMNLTEASSYSFSDLKEIAKKGGVENVLQGTFAQAGENFRLDIMLQDSSTGKLIGSENIEGKGQESFFSMVDELTKRIKKNFKITSESIASDIDRDIGEITTSSPEAYKYYIEASKFFDAGDYRQAIKLYETATAVDAEFASAYRSMAMAYYNIGYYAEGDKFVQKAFELSDRVSDRELYRNKAEFYRISEKTYDLSIEAYNKLLELYPDDESGLNNLALLYEEIEEYDKAIELYILAVQGESSDFLSTTNLAAIYRSMGLFDEAKNVLEDYLRNYEDNASLRGTMASIHLDEGNYDLALQEIEKASILNPTHHRNFRNKGDILFCRGDMSNAEREYKKLLSESNPISNAFGYGRLARFYFNLGRIEDAIIHGESFVKHAQKMGQKFWEGIFSLATGNFLLSVKYYQEALEKISTAQKIAAELEDWNLERRALFSKGRALVMMGSSIEAQKVAEELEELCQKSLNKRIIRLHHHLEGMIDLENGNYDSAIESIKKALSLDPDNYKPNLDLLGMAYYRSGNLDKAITEYEKIINCPSGIRTYEGVYVKSFYMLGNIYEEQGNTAKAVENYEKFLDLWKDADPGLPEVDDARTRLIKMRERK
ncbi:MAG: protein kinase [Candidatus Aminicenantes bacterium]|nr:MAG: protein kinase [Candidatus Aminicenantes bacterium]